MLVAARKSFIHKTLFQKRNRLTIVSIEKWAKNNATIVVDQDDSCSDGIIVIVCQMKGDVNY